MTRGKLIVLTPEGETTEADLRSAPGLGRLQKIVGGYIEIVPQFTSYRGEPCVAVCCEEGKLQNLRVNREATQAWIDAMEAAGQPVMMQDDLLGNVAILTGEEILRAL